VIAVVVLTHNRAHLFERCIQDVLGRTSEKTSEIIVWDNASSDATGGLLDAIDDPRIRVVRSPDNIGINAYAQAVALTTAPYIVELDDDVIEAPRDWDATLLDAFLKIPNIGYLVADLKEDPNDSAYLYLKFAKEERKVFTRKEVNGVTILEGPTGGGCSMTSREVYDRVGGFRQHGKLVFWHEDASYARDVSKLGYRTGILEDLKVWHAGSPYYSKPSPAKLAFHEHRARTDARKNLVKRVLLALPFFAALNERHRWFSPPEHYVPPDLRPKGDEVRPGESRRPSSP
jgi:GT2 family glycosyltransferase